MTLRDLLAAAIPGPWRVSLTDDTVVIGPDRAEVAAIDGDYNEPDLWPIMEANARLIALTPQLAAALIKAEEALASIAANTCCDGCQEAALVARAALSEIRALTGGNDD